MENLKPNSEILRLPGTYLLILKREKPGSATIGKIGTMALLTGYYLYIGSAFGPGGISARVNRHISRNKPLRWHIDYLRTHCLLEHVFLNYSNIRLESDWVKNLLKNPNYQIPLQGFGASDSDYPSHLFYSAGLPTDDEIAATLDTEDLFKLSPMT